MKLKLLLAFGVIGVLTACGGTGSDPMEDQSKPVQDAKPDDSKEEVVTLKPELKTAMEIKTKPYYTFSEGEVAEIKVSATSSYAAKYYLEVTNLSDFDKAQVTSEEGDQGTGKNATLTMKWKVPKGLSISSDGQMKLSLAVHTKGFTSKGLADDRTVTKDVLIMLSSISVNKPVVTKVMPLGTAVKENTASSTFKVYVTDEDAIDLDGSRPTLVIMPPQSGINGASYLVPKPAVKDPSAPNSWVFDVSVNLLNMEVTQKNGTAFFDVAAFSPRSGNMSNPVTGSYDIWTSVSKPMTSWTEDVGFKLNTVSSYTFTVSDPKGEGQITASFATNCSSLPGAPQCSCVSIDGVNGNPNGAAQCTITWAPPNAFLYWEQVFVISVTNKSSVPGDKEQQTVQFNGKIKFI